MSPRFTISDTRLAGVKVLTRAPVGDARGFLDRLFDLDELGKLLGGKTVAQVNHTLTKERGAVRGLHFQLPPHAEAKLVSCLRGEVFDVAVDLRRGSSTFLKWHAERLSQSNHRSLLIPEGCAHGFQTLAADCELLYVHSAPYKPETEGGVNVRDPRLAIAWPERITMLSPRDEAHQMLTDAFPGIAL
jgi:dTDP-4-dehydrorhamnose 3,5-epimerase